MTIQDHIEEVNIAVYGLLHKVLGIFQAVSEQLGAALF